MLANIPRLLYAIMTTAPDAPWCLDLFCGAGGAGMGYKLAGFNVLGVDIQPQPRFPGWFVQADALEFGREYGHLFDMIHASPPCQRYSSSTRANGTQDNHPDLVDPVREILEQSGARWVIENVQGAPLKNALKLCGTMFNLMVIRHRYFECDPPIWFAPATCRHWTNVVKQGMRPEVDRQFHQVTGHFTDQDYARRAMGIHWMDGQREMAESIPPAYTHYIGQQMMRAIRAKE